MEFEISSHKTFQTKNFIQQKFKFFFIIGQLGGGGIQTLDDSIGNTRKCQLSYKNSWQQKFKFYKTPKCCLQILYPNTVKDFLNLLCNRTYN